MDRPWSLDSIPLLIPPAEWSSLEAGLIQRARLLNYILADLYGPQELLLDGDLPPALVFGNPGFLAACHGVPVPVHLPALVGCRPGALARRPTVGSLRPHPGPFRRRLCPGKPHRDGGNVSRPLPRVPGPPAGGFLPCLPRSAAESLALAAKPPRVVLLTPGPLNETYFEHSYLARYLGFTLVQGGDLTVRESRVFLKSLEGLKPVDVILRRVDDSFCDPLELRSDSFLGVAGPARSRARRQRGGG